MELDGAGAAGGRGGRNPHGAVAPGDVDVHLDLGKIVPGRHGRARDLNVVRGLVPAREPVEVGDVVGQQIRRAGADGFHAIDIELAKGRRARVRRIDIVGQYTVRSAVMALLFLKHYTRGIRKEA